MLFLWLVVPTLSGGIFSDKSNGKDAIAAFIDAANYFNRQSDVVSLEPNVRIVDTTDSYEVQKAGI